METIMRDLAKKTLALAIALAAGCLNPPDTRHTPARPDPPIGPVTGRIDTAYTFETVTTDPDSDYVRYRASATGGDTTDWTGLRPSGDTFAFTVTFFALDTYEIRSQAKDEDDSLSEWSNPHTIWINSRPNHPPCIRGQPTGLSDATTGVQCWFRIRATDQDDDSVTLRADLGNGDTTDWGSVRPSGRTAYCYGTYSNPATYDVRVQAQDQLGGLSNWSDPLQVTATAPDFPWQVVDSMSVGAGACAAVASPNGDFVYAAVQQGLRVIRTADNTLAGSVDLRGLAEVHNMLAVSPDGSVVFVAAPDAQMVWVVNTGNNTIADSIPTGADCRALALSPDGQRLYVACLSASSVLVVRTSDYTIEETIACPSPRGLACLPNGQRLYVASTQSKVYVIRTSDYTLEDSVHTGGAVDGLAARPDGAFVYVMREDSIILLRTADNVIIGHAKQFGHASSIAGSPDGRWMYVPNTVWGCYPGVAVIRTSDHALVADIPVLAGADGGIAVLPDGSRLYQAGGWSSDFMTVIGR